MLYFMYIEVGLVSENKGGLVSYIAKHVALLFSQRQFGIFCRIEVLMLNGVTLLNVLTKFRAKQLWSILLG